jgi:hypothetical protein
VGAKIATASRQAAIHRALLAVFEKEDKDAGRTRARRSPASAA